MGWSDCEEAPAPPSIRWAPHSARPSGRGGREEEVEMSGREGRGPVLVGSRDFRLPPSSLAFLSGRGHQPDKIYHFNVLFVEHGICV